MKIEKNYHITMSNSANRRFSIAKAKTFDNKEIVLTYISFHAAQPRKKEHLAAIAPIHGWNSGDPVDILVENIESFVAYNEGIDAAAAINRLYLDSVEENRPADNQPEYVTIAELIEGEEYRILLPRRETETVRIKGFHRDRRLTEVEHVLNNHTEVIVSELTHWEKV